MTRLMALLTITIDSKLRRCDPAANYRAPTACLYAVGATPALSRKRWLKWLAFA